MPHVRVGAVAVALALAVAPAAPAAAVAAPVTGEPTPGPRAAAVVKGAIAERYQSLGGARGFLGQPLTDELATPSRPGRFNVFQGGSIYWTAATGAWEVHGLIRDRWGALGWENSFLGFPTSNEQRVTGGAFSRFQGGHLYWSPATGPRVVRGAIFQHWAGLGWEAGRLGFPVTDELPTRGAPGAYNDFQGGSVYWSEGTGAVQVEGDIRRRWRALGAEGSALGFPVYDEAATPYGRVSVFQQGAVEWSPSTGARVVAATGTVRDLSKSEDRFVLEEVQERFTYAEDDEFLLVDPSDPEAEQVQLTVEEFEALLVPGSVVSTFTTLDPGEQWTFALRAAAPRP